MLVSSASVNSTKVTQVFLSYSHRNKEAAVLIREQLEKNGLRVFHDDQSIRSGEQWMSKIEKGLNECSAFIVLIGKDGIRRWVGAEVQIAINRNLAPQDDAERLHIFPVILPDGDYDSLPPFLSLFQIHEWMPQTGLTESLIDSVTNRVGLFSQKELIEGCPYMGLSVFQREDARLFFGRQQETLDALNLLGDPQHGNPEDQVHGRGYNRWLQIEGNSGSGKSSFVNAGLMSLIEQGVLWGQTGYEFWDTIGKIAPGQKPLEMLAELLMQKFKSGPGMGEWVQRLENDADTLRYVLREHKEADKAFLLVVDQFEELLTITEENQRIPFERLLANALEDQECPFFLISTIRSDFLGDLDKLPGLSAHYNQICGRYRLGTITLDGLKEVIEKPAELAGLDVSEVTTAILNDSREELGVLPLVENALAYLWEYSKGNKLDGDLYHEKGGIAGLLENQADALLNRMDKKQRDNSLDLLLRLTHIGTEGRNTRQRVPLPEALEIAGGGDTVAGQTLLNTLAGLGGKDKKKGHAGLRLIIVANDGDEYVDLIHETLIRPRGKDENGKVVGYWNRLYEHIDKNRDRDILRQQLKFRSERWNQSGWLGKWWHLSSFFETRRYKVTRPLQGSPEYEFLRWSKRKSLANLVIAVGLFGYIAESYFWTLKNELPVASMVTLQKFRLGYKPIPELVKIEKIEGFMEGEENNDFIKTIPKSRHINFGYPPKEQSAPEPFFMGKFEITYDEFDYFVWSQHREDNHDVVYPATGKGGRGNQPAGYMTWYDASHYALWLSEQNGMVCRLPYELEWEYAAKAGTHTGYPWGNDVEGDNANKANCDGCGSQWDRELAAPVGQFEPNAFGLYDMNGNVWEMMIEPWDDGLQGSTGSEMSRVVRGGSFFEGPAISRSTARFSKTPSKRHYHIGFRVVCL